MDRCSNYGSAMQHDSVNKNEGTTNKPICFRVTFGCCIMT